MECDVGGVDRGLRGFVTIAAISTALCGKTNERLRNRTYWRNGQFHVSDSLLPSQPSYWAEHMQPRNRGGHQC